MNEDAKKETGQLEIYFGALAPKVSEQIKAQGFSAEPDILEHWDKDAYAITRLHVRGCLSDAEVHKARRRLMRSITKKLRKTP